MTTTRMATCDEVAIAIVRIGPRYQYRIPSFPGITVALRHAAYRTTREDDSVGVFDGFMQDCRALERDYPASAAVQTDITKAWFVNPLNPVDVYTRHKY